MRKTDFSKTMLKAVIGHNENHFMFTPHFTLHCYYPHLKLDAQRGQKLVQDHKTSTKRSQNSNLALGKHHLAKIFATSPIT